MKSHILSYTIKDTTDEIEIFTDHYEVFCDEEENNTTFQQAQKSLNKLESDYEKESYKEIYCHNISLIVETSEHYAVEDDLTRQLIAELTHALKLLKVVVSEATKPAIARIEKLLQQVQ